MTQYVCASTSVVDGVRRGRYYVHAVFFNLLFIYLIPLWLYGCIVRYERLYYTTVYNNNNNNTTYTNRFRYLSDNN